MTLDLSFVFPRQGFPEGLRKAPSHDAGPMREPAIAWWPDQVGYPGHRSQSDTVSRTCRLGHLQYDPTVAASREQQLDDLVWLRRARDRIDREYAQPLDVEAIADGVHMSAGHFSRQFKSAYGETPYSYLMTRRVERAMALLRRGDLSVTEVCFEVGFSSLGTFSTRFTELVGVPPSIYRAEYAGVTTGMPPCVAKQVTRPIRNREAISAGGA